MKSNNCIIPECYVDSCLVEVLFQADRKNGVNHEKSNGRVAMKMTSKQFSDEFCVGIIDEDRKQLDFLKEFGSGPKLDTPWLRLWRHADPNKHHYLIQIRPVIEVWILDLCKSHQINLADFSLPRDLNSLIKVTKSVAARSDTNMIRLFKHMAARHCEGIVQLKAWITYLKDKNFSADLNDLKEV